MLKPTIQPKLNPEGGDKQSMAMGSKAFESPLISHVRMRAMYRALIELRALAHQLKDRSFRNLEACYVGTAIDLNDGDLISDTGSTHEPLLLEHIRTVGRREAAAAPTPATLKRTLHGLREPSLEAFPGSAYERVLCAIGAAMAQKAAAAQVVAIAYVRVTDLSAAEWKRIFTLMAQPALPLVIVVLPAETRLDLEALALKAAGSPEVAIPVVPVDAGDPIALYRVTQETLVRARAAGGAAVILGVTCGTDPIKLLATQLIRKQICTERWIAAADSHLKGSLASF